MQTILPGKMLHLNAVAANGGMSQPYRFFIRDPQRAVRSRDHLVQVIGFQSVCDGESFPISIAEAQQTLVTRKPEPAILIPGATLKTVVLFAARHEHAFEPRGRTADESTENWTACSYPEPLAGIPAHTRNAISFKS